MLDETVSRRGRVIDAAMRLLADQGARGFTHREVDRRMALPLGSTSNFFRRREDLFVAVAERVLALDLAGARTAFAAIAAEPCPSLSLVAAMLADYYETWLERDPGGRTIARMEVLFESFRNEALKPVTNKVALALNSLHEPIFKSLGSKDPIKSAEMFSRLVSGMPVMIVTDPRPFDRSILETLLSHYLTISLEAPQVGY